MDSMTFVLFGATGDLAKRKIYPALYNLFLDENMPTSFSVVGLGRRGMSNREFQARVEDSLVTFSRRMSDDQSKMQEFLKAFRYTSLDVNNSDDYKYVTSNDSTTGGRVEYSRKPDVLFVGCAGIL